MINWALQANPQTAEEAQTTQPCPEIVEATINRGITKVVHFTTTHGLKGILSTGFVKARRDLPEDERVKYVYEENAADRGRDLPWHGYINLSVTKINLNLFTYSKRWHPEDQWVILEFDPKILGDPGVVFCTTNNAYSNVKRCRGLEGFEQMFAPEVPWGHYGSVHNRSGRQSNQTTDPQAEVLYPFELSLDSLNKLIVNNDSTCDVVTGICSHFPQDLNIIIDPEAFT